MNLQVGNILLRRVVGAVMENTVKEAMDRGGIADITTTGRKSGLPRRIEIYFHHFDGTYYLTGRPGRKRDWAANIEANPEFILHLKRGVEADVSVAGESEPNSEVRGDVLLRILTENWDTPADEAKASIPRWVEESPFVRFHPTEKGPVG